MVCWRSGGGSRKLRRETEWISKRVRLVFSIPIKQNKQTTEENIDCWRCCGFGGKFEGGALLNTLRSHEAHCWSCHARHERRRCCCCWRSRHKWGRRRIQTLIVHWFAELAPNPWQLICQGSEICALWWLLFLQIIMLMTWLAQIICKELMQEM